MLPRCPVLQESDALQGELKLLQAERGSLSREVALKQQLEAGWAARAGQQAAALKEAQAKAATLEQSLQQVCRLQLVERMQLVGVRWHCDAVQTPRVAHT
jgi:hypothetical protein